jgi:glycosyltransferase involved in cell wall biosynthesis
VRIELVFPKFKLLSGAERLILGLARALGERGHDVSVLCHAFDPSCLPLADGLAIRQTGVRLEWSGNHYLDSLASYLRAGRLRRELAAGVDAVCLFGPALTLAALPRRWFSSPVLYFCYEPPRAAAVDREAVLERVGAWRRILAPALAGYRRVDRWLVNRVDGILVNGEFGRERVLEEYGKPSTVITHGVRLFPVAESREAARGALGIDTSARVAITVNFLHPRKRVDLLLRSWREVERRSLQALLVIVGDGPESAALRVLAERLGLQRVRFAGFVDEADLPRYYRAADLLCHVAREETFGFTILEAGEHELAVVCVDEGGPRYTVRDGETGVLVPAQEHELAGAIASLLGDTARAQEMGRRGREWVRANFTWQRGAEDFEIACGKAGVAPR